MKIPIDKIYPNPEQPRKSKAYAMRAMHDMQALLAESVQEGPG